MMSRPEDLDFNLIKQAKIFHFGSISMTDEPVISATLAAVKYPPEALQEKAIFISVRRLEWGWRLIIRCRINRCAHLPLSISIKINTRLAVRCKRVADLIIGYGSSFIPKLICNKTCMN